MSQYESTAHRRAAKMAITVEPHLQAFRGFLRMRDESRALEELDLIAGVIADMRAVTLGFANADEQNNIEGMF